MHPLTMICSDWYDPLAGMNQFSFSELSLLQLNTARPLASTAVFNGPCSFRARRPARAAELSDPWPVASADREAVAVGSLRTAYSNEDYCSSVICLGA